MATTINLANVSIGMDITKLKQGMGATGAEIRKIGSVLRESEEPASKFRREMDLMNRALQSGGITIEQYEQAQEKLAKKYGIVTPAMERQQQELAALAEAEKKAADAAREQAEAERARQEQLARGRQLTDSVRTSTEIYSDKLHEYRNALRDGIITQDTFDRLVEKTNRDLMQAESKTDQLTRSIQKQNAEKQNGTRIGGAFAGQLRNIASMAAGALTISSAASVVQEFDAIIDKSEQLGVSYKDLMIIGRTLEESGGISFDQAGQAISKMQVNLANARDKGGDLDSTLKKLGLSSRQLANMDAVTAFQTISASFSQIGGQADKMQFATQLFGKAGIDMVPALETSANKFAEMEQHLRQAGLLQDGLAGSISKAADDAARMKDHFSGVALQVVSLLQPAMENVLKLIQQSTAGWRNLGTAVNGVVNQGDEIDKALGITYDSEILQRMTKQQREESSNFEAEMRARFIRRQRYEEQLAAKRKEIEADIESIQLQGVKNREELERKIAGMKDEAFRRGEREFEAMQRAAMGNEKFERSKILNPGYEMTEGERIQAAETIDNMAETRRQNAMTQLRSEMEASQKRLRDEAQVAEMRKQNVLASDEDRRKAVDVQNWFDEQHRQEQKRLAERIAEIKRQGGSDEFIERAKRDSEFRSEQMRQTAQAALDQIDAESRAGVIEKKRGTLEAERERILGVSGPNVAATIAPAIRAGTVEAYKAVNQQNEQRAARAEQMKRLDDIKAELQKLNAEKTVVLTRVR